MKKDQQPCGRLSPKALAVAFGTILGAYAFLLAIILSANPSARFLWVSPEMLGFLSAIYPGYAAGLAGALIGLAWGAVCGAVCGGLTAWIHNLTLQKYCRD